MFQRTLIAITLACSFLFSFAEGEKLTTRALLGSVTVYHSGAELTHTASAVLRGGNNDLVIDNISNDIDINSIQIKAPNTVTILSVEFSNNFLVPDNKSARTVLLEDSLQHVQDNISRIDLSILNTTDLLEVLKANRDIKGTQTGVSVAELIRLMEYYKTKSLELQTMLLQLKDKKKKAAEGADKIQQQLDEERKKNIATAGRLTLQLSAAVPVNANFTISYIAQNAYWTPFYDVRVENITGPMKLICKAKIVQTTGINWKGVKLSLSTSAPSQWGAAPQLQSWFLGYIDPVAAMDKTIRLRGNINLTGSVAGLVTGSALNEVVVTGYSSSNKEAADKDYAPKPVYIVNGAIMSDAEFQKINPNAIKKMEKLKGSAAAQLYGAQAAGGATVVTLKEGLEDYIAVADKALNISFDLDIPYDVPTNGKEQTAILKTIDVPALYRHYAVPKLDNNAFLVADVINWQQLNLLPGDANIILEGTYAGKSFINPNDTKDTLSITLGSDKRIAIKREKINDVSSIKFLGSNKLQKFTYEITVKNNKNEAVNMTLNDQYPLTTNKDIEVELPESSNATADKETGLLNWQFALAPGEVKKLRFVYTVKYPKDKVLNLD